MRCQHDAARKGLPWCQLLNKQSYVYPRLSCPNMLKLNTFSLVAVVTQYRKNNLRFPLTYLHRPELYDTKSLDGGMETCRLTPCKDPTPKTVPILKHLGQVFWVQDCWNRGVLFLAHTSGARIMPSQVASAVRRHA